MADIDAILAQEAMNLQNQPPPAQQQQQNPETSTTTNVANEQQQQLENQQQQPPPPPPTVENYDPNGLIPMCVQNPSEPTFNAEVFGFDIKTLNERPWSKPGANLSSYFNYGFDEEAWRVYCALQLRGSNSHRARADAFLENILRGQKPSVAASAASAVSGTSVTSNIVSSNQQQTDGKGTDQQQNQNQQQQQQQHQFLAHHHHHHHMQQHHHHHMQQHHHHHHAFMQHHAGFPTTAVPPGFRGLPPGVVGVGGVRPPTTGAGGGVGQQQTSFFKTRLCHQFMQTGQCPNGTECKYAHGEADLRQAVPMSAAVGGSNPQQVAASANVVAPPPPAPAPSVVSGAGAPPQPQPTGAGFAPPAGFFNQSTLDDSRPTKKNNPE